MRAGLRRGPLARGPSERLRDGFDAARLYLDFRWLGESPAQLADPGSGWYLDDLLVRGGRLGLT